MRAKRFLTDPAFRALVSQTQDLQDELSSRKKENAFLHQRLARLEAELAEWRRELEDKQARYAALERARLGPVRHGPRRYAEDEGLRAAGLRPAPMSDEGLALVEACREAQSQVDRIKALIAVVKGRWR